MRKKFDIFVNRGSGGFTYEFTLWIDDGGSPEINGMRAIREYKRLIRFEERPEVQHYYFQASESTNPLTIQKP